MDIWVVNTFNQLLIRGSYNEIKKKVQFYLQLADTLFSGHYSTRTGLFSLFFLPMSGHYKQF